MLVLEEAGRAGLPHPLVETAAVAAPLVAGDGTDRGDGRDVTPGPGPAGAPDAHGLGMVASDLGGPHVACAADADWLLLRDPAAGALHLVDPAATVLTPLDTVDRGRRAATVDWQPTPETVVTDDPAAVALALDRGAFGAAALLVGLGQRMLDLTVAYVTERRQFGVPIGSFQAVKHHLADALKELAFARPAVHRAAHSLATGADTRPATCRWPRPWRRTPRWFVGRQALQCHGAIGYTVEHDLQLYLKRTWALAQSWGTPSHHRTRVAEWIGI